MNEKAYKLGIDCSPVVTYAIARNEHSGRWLGSISIEWLCSISIDDMYYETEPYKDKDSAVSELLGCLEALKEKIEQVRYEVKQLCPDTELNTDTLATPAVVASPTTVTSCRCSRRDSSPTSGLTSKASATERAQRNY